MQAEKVNNTEAVPQIAPAKEEGQVHTLLLEIRDTLTVLERAVTNKQTRTISKLTKQVRKYRHVIKAHHLLAVYETLGVDAHTSLLKNCKSNSPAFTEKLEISKTLVVKIIRTLELQAFLKLLLIQICWSEQLFDDCLAIVGQLLIKITSANRRSLDNYNAVLHHYLVRAHEKKGTDLAIREQLLQAYNRSCVRSDEMGQCTILNLLLRSYLRHNNIDAAYNLIEKTSFPQSKSNNQFCKYLLYTGRVKAVRREYADALSRLNQAIRKSPDSAKGFKIQCQKVAIVVELLQGEIPNREIFSDVVIFTNVYPYYKLIQVVLEGELTNFNKTVELYRPTYEKDRLYTVILRLNQIVIRIGLRRISLAYSRISLQDIATKLNIPNEDVEFVVAKALRDSIMHGEIDHEKQILRIEGAQNIYVTNEPQIGLNKRIRYCLGLYHEVQKAITYPDMKISVEEGKQTEIDAAELLNLLDFDDEM